MTKGSQRLKGQHWQDDVPGSWCLFTKTLIANSASTAKLSVTISECAKLNLKSNKKLYVGHSHGWRVERSEWWRNIPVVILHINQLANQYLNNYLKISCNLMD